MSSEEQSCRICRGEATPDDPLFYPCKCRGSIKYIHQGCLEEWLKHSGREASCDICHEVYKFTTQYKDDTPDRVPIKLIFLKLKNSSLHLLRYGLTITALVFGVFVQIPLFWKAASRFLTWIIDGAMPHESLLVSLIYGEILIEGDPYQFSNIWKALTATYFDSVSFMILWILVHLILFLEHEWVSRDPGFKTLILKKIGPAENSRPVAVPNRNVGENPVEFNDRILRDVQNLERLLQQRDNPQNEVIHDALRIIQDRQRALQREHQHQLRQRNNQEELLDEEDEELDPDFVPSDSSDNESERNLNLDEEDADLLRRIEENREVMRARVNNQLNDNPQVQRPMIPFPFAGERDQPAGVPPVNDEIDEIDIDNRRQRQFLDRMARLPAHLVEQNEAAVRREIFGREDGPGDNNIPDINMPNGNINLNGGGGANVNIDPAAAAAAAAAVNAIPGEQDDLLLSLPIYMIIVGGDAFLGVYLFLAYFLPSGLGNLAYISTGMILEGAFHLLNNVVDYFSLRVYFEQVSEVVLNAKNYHPTVSQVLDDYLIFPVVKTLTNVFDHTLPQSTLERIIPLLVFYGAVYTGILSYLSYKTKKHSKNNPLIGLQRKLFIILLDFVSTLKVFLIFAIELVVFPIYCGFLLEIVGSPVFSYDHPLILSALFLVKDHLSLRLVTYWAAGTIYMCLFALFVGMTRRYILRPGVLFFIRSPEDPNARLIHDALVRPLGLQVSRIALSGFVYSIFILVGFGGVTYTLKLTNSPVLPIHFQSSLAILLVNVTIYRVRENMDLIKKYVRQYWVRAFRISSAKLRLSSFIFGKHDPRERGYVVYRNLLCRFLKVKPDYTEPKSLREAREIFKTTDVKAVFIPDGDLVRAPKNDTVSRKFVRKLFIPVSKDDKPLSSSRKIIEKLDEKYPLDEFDDSEDELTTTNQYEIVYRPPLFRERTIAFLAMLWVFAVLLIGGVGLIANIVGMPVHFIMTQLVGLLREGAPFKSLFLEGKSDFNVFALETTCILNGLQIIVTALKLYDDYIQRRYIQLEEDSGEESQTSQNENVGNEETVAEQNEAAQGNNAIPVIRNQRQQTNAAVIGDVLKFLGTNLKIVFATAFFFLNVSVSLYLAISTHVQAIEEPFRHYNGEPELSTDGAITFMFSRYTLPLHFILLFFTIIPFEDRFRTDVRNGLRNGLFEILNIKSVLKNYTKPLLIRLASFELVVGLIKLGFAVHEYKENTKLYTSFKAVLIYTFVNKAIYVDAIAYVWSVVVLLNVLVRGAIKGWVLFNKVNQQIKEEYYTTGKTLENSEFVEEKPRPKE